VIRRVPFDGDEKTTLLEALDRHRDVLVWKLDGLDEEQARRPMVPSGTSLLGIVKHVAAVDYEWFCSTFGRDTEPLPFDDDDPDADLRVNEGETVQDILAFYARARAASNSVIAEVGLEDKGRAWFGEDVTLRWVLVHMLEETARHAGHMDILRELVDGATGEHPD
jgi:uncharacterized damage-inducible protein DinB